MGSAGGFILNLADERREEFESSLFTWGQFGEPVRDFDHRRNSALVCFVLAANGAITHIGSGHKGIRAGSGLRRLNISSIEKLAPPVQWNEVSAAIPHRSTQTISQRVEKSGLLPPRAFQDFIETLLRIAPQTRPFIERYSQQRRARIAKLAPKVKAVLAEQKEAVATSLFLSGIDRTPLQDWVPPIDAAPQSFLDGLPQARLREDQMIINDLLVLPGHDLLKTTSYSAALFQGEGVRLTVVLANRLPLEETFGTDLIYYNETFRSFLMVQYKAMEREGKQDVFRLPSQDLTREVQRMDQVIAQLGNCARDGSREGFRFAQNPFFLKFCPRLAFDPDDKGLVHGMYLPLDYWKLIENHPALLGKQGGRRLTYRNVGRYFDNSAFAALVAGAWVGTTVTQSTVLEPIIRSIIENGRAVAVAIKRDDDPSAGAQGQVSDHNPLAGMTVNEDEEIDINALVEEA